MTRVLVTSWCSFDEVVATVGDERAVETVSGWLTTAGVDHVVAWAGYLDRGPRPGDLDPAAFTDLVFVCGPLLPAPPLTALLRRTTALRRTAVGVSVVDPAVARSFDTVLARDGAGPARPDLAARPGPTPSTVLAVVLAPPQPEYGDRGRHAQVRSVVAEWLAARGHGWFEVETDVWTPDRTTRHAGQVTAALARADAVVTSRLHGLVLGRAAGRPVVAVDPVAGGAKVAAQATALGWPVVLDAGGVDAAALDDALRRCLSSRPPPGTSPGPAWDRMRVDLLAAVGGTGRSGYR